MEAKELIQSSNDLVTSLEQVRAGFIEFALEKSKHSAPLIKAANKWLNLVEQL